MAGIVEKGGETQKIRQAVLWVSMATPTRIAPGDEQGRGAAERKNIERVRDLYRTEIQRRKHVADRADRAVPTRQHGTDHADHTENR